MPKHYSMKKTSESMRMKKGIIHMPKSGDKPKRKGLKAR